MKERQKKILQKVSSTKIFKHEDGGFEVLTTILYSGI
jgi:hypothetical protein